jgi:dethiobiotin synthetase
LAGRVVVITGTGTGIGKTHLAVALVRGWGETARVCGLKPVETGVDGRDGGDARLLHEASTFHVKPSLPWYRFVPPISPHLAARRAGTAIHPGRITRGVADVAALADGVVVELAGGLFSPLGPGLLNADLVRLLLPADVLLVAPDRLGVLHDVGAATRAAGAGGVPVRGVVLMAPATPDDSTGTNATELALVSSLPVVACFPRATAAELARSPAMTALLAHVLGTKA